MKYTVTIIDTEEKFREKFGSDPQWVISTPRGKNIEKSVKKKNMMDPTKEFMEPVNTPSYMSPASESYWSM